MARTRVQEMGLTHTEFFRTLPAALVGRQWQRDGNTVRIADESGGITIHLSPQGERRITPQVRLPVTVVSFEFPDHDEARADAFMRHFQRYFQRGGG